MIMNIFGQTILPSTTILIISELILATAVELLLGLFGFFSEVPFAFIRMVLFKSLFMYESHISVCLISTFLFCFLNSSSLFFRRFLLGQRVCNISLHQVS